MAVLPVIIYDVEAVIQSKRAFQKKPWVRDVATRIALRTKVAEAQNWRCCYCGVRMDTDIPDGNIQSQTYITLEHVKPKSMGGTDHEDNVVAACHGCNGRRGVKEAMWFFEHRQSYKPAPRLARVTKDSIDRITRDPEYFVGRFRKKQEKYAAKGEVLDRNMWISSFRHGPIFEKLLRDLIEGLSE